MVSIKRFENMETRMSLPTQWSSQNLIEQPFPTSILTPDANVN